MRGKRGRRVEPRPGTVSADGEIYTTMSVEEFYELSIEELLDVADKVGVSLQGAETMEQARTRLLNDASFLN